MHKNNSLAETVRNTAYFLWEQDGRPEGHSFDYWLKAKEMHLRQIAYDKWLAEGAPIGREQDIWFDVAKKLDET